MCLDRAASYGLHVSPSPEALKATQKSSKNNDIFQNPYFSPKISKTYQKRTPKGLQMGDFILVVAPLGELLGHHWSHKPFYDTENEPTASSNWPQGPKKAPKMSPKVQKMTPKVPLRVNSLRTLTLNLRFVHLARRTARSALYIYIYIHIYIYNIYIYIYIHIYIYIYTSALATQDGKALQGNPGSPV